MSNIDLSGAERIWVAMDVWRAAQELGQETNRQLVDGTLTIDSLHFRERVEWEYSRIVMAHRIHPFQNTTLAAYGSGQFTLDDMIEGYRDQVRLYEAGRLAKEAKRDKIEALAADVKAHKEGQEQ